MDEGYGAQRAHLMRLQQTRDELAQRLDILRMMVQGQQDQLAREEEVMEQLSSTGSSSTSMVGRLRRTAQGGRGVRGGGDSGAQFHAQIMAEMANAPARDTPGNQARRYLAGINSDTLGGADDTTDDDFDSSPSRRIRLVGRATDVNGRSGFIVQAAGGSSGSGGSGSGFGPEGLVASLENAMMLHAIQLSLQAIEPKPSVPGISEEAKERLVHFHLTRESLKTRLEGRNMTTQTKKVAATEDLNNIGEKDCAVCQESMDWLTYCTELPCAHFFCNDCIMPWLEKTRTCPICREEVVAENTPPPVPPPRGVLTTSSGSAGTTTTVVVPPAATLPYPTGPSTSPIPRPQWSASPPPPALQIAATVDVQTAIEGPQFFPTVWRAPTSATLQGEEEGGGSTIIPLPANSRGSSSSHYLRASNLPPPASDMTARATAALQRSRMTEREVHASHGTSAPQATRTTNLSGSVITRQQTTSSILDDSDDDDAAEENLGMSGGSITNNRSSNSRTFASSGGTNARLPRHTTTLRSTGGPTPTPTTTGGGRVQSIRGSVAQTRGSAAAGNNASPSSQQAQRTSSSTNMSTSLRRGSNQRITSQRQPTRPLQGGPSSNSTRNSLGGARTTTSTAAAGLSESDRAVLAALNPLMRRRV